MQNSIEGDKNNVCRALTSTLTRKVENRVRDISRYILSVDSIGIDNPITGASNSGIIGVTILTTAADHLDQIIFFTDSLRYVGSETGEIIGERPQLSTGEKRYTIGKAYGDIVKIYTPGEYGYGNMLFAKSVLNTESKIELLPMLEATDGRIISDIIRYEKNGILKVREKDTMIHIEDGGRDSITGKEFYVYDTLRSDGKLELAQDCGNIDNTIPIKQLEDGTEINDIRWFTPGIGGIAIISTPGSTKYERKGMEVYLTARMRNDMYEISPVALMTTDGTKVQRVEQWVLGIPFMRIVVEHRVTWAKSALTRDGKIELLPEPPMTTSGERIKKLGLE